MYIYLQINLSINPSIWTHEHERLRDILVKSDINYRNINSMTNARVYLVRGNR